MPTTPIAPALDSISLDALADVTGGCGGKKACNKKCAPPPAPAPAALPASDSVETTVSVSYQ